jgi:hypothetical protein
MRRLPIPGGVPGRGPQPKLATQSMPMSKAAGGSAGGSDGGVNSLLAEQGVLGGGGLKRGQFAPLRPNQEQVLGNLMRVREMVMAEMSKLDQQRVNEFLNACSEGNEYRIRKVRVCVLGGGCCAACEALCGWHW